MQYVYLNGELIAPENAKVSVFDRGFVFADGVYEVIPAYGGRLFRLAQHLERLEHSLAGIRLENPLSAAGWRAVFEQLLAQYGKADQYLYLQVTRGAAPRDHAFPAGVAPTVFAFAKRIEYPSAELIQRGVTGVTLADIRWSRCDIKSIALLPNVLMRQQAIDGGAVEAILLRDGLVTEGAASNVFVVYQGQLLTPPKGPFILPGITRDLVVELARAGAVDFAERPITEAELRAADEVWMTSSTKEILPLVRLDGRPVGSGRPGPVHARLFAAYQDYKARFRAGQVE